jgi:hypothetical protein
MHQNQGRAVDLIEQGVGAARPPKSGVYTMKKLF